MDDELSLCESSKELTTSLLDQAKAEINNELGFEYREGDFIRLKDISEYNINRLNGFDVNVFEIINIEDDIYRLNGYSVTVLSSEIEPIPINGKDDFDIYYDPQIAASISPRKKMSSYRKDFTYYYDAFERSYKDAKNFKEIINDRGYKYVHEIQHFLGEIHQPRALKIRAR